MMCLCLQASSTTSHSFNNKKCNSAALALFCPFVFIVKPPSEHPQRSKWSPCQVSTVLWIRIFFLNRGTMGTAQDERYSHTRVAQVWAAHDSQCACLCLCQHSCIWIYQTNGLSIIMHRVHNLSKSGYTSAVWQLNCFQTVFSRETRVPLIHVQVYKKAEKAQLEEESITDKNPLSV